MERDARGVFFMQGGGRDAEETLEPWIFAGKRYDGWSWSWSWKKKRKR